MLKFGGACATPFFAIGPYLHKPMIALLHQEDPGLQFTDLSLLLPAVFIAHNDITQFFS